MKNINFILGTTGTGKSTFLKDVAQGFSNTGQNYVVIQNFDYIKINGAYEIILDNPETIKDQISDFITQIGNNANAVIVSVILPKIELEQGKETIYKLLKTLIILKYQANVILDEAFMLKYNDLKEILSENKFNSLYLSYQFIGQLGQQEFESIIPNIKSLKLFSSSQEDFDYLNKLLGKNYAYTDFNELNRSFDIDL